MNKKLLALVISMGVAASVVAQCNLADHDWGTATFGVSPDPELGETFIDGTLGIDYHDVIYVKAPMQAGDIDTTYADFNVAIDSLRLDSITLFNGIGDVSLSTIGLTVMCNNNGDAPNDCTFLGGGTYCGDIDGIPTAAGVFSVKIYVTGFINFFGPVAVPYEFENYTLTIVDPNSVARLNALPELTVAQNAPNPVLNETTIAYELNTNSEATLVIQNLLGERIYTRTLNGRVGENKVKVNTSEFNSGVYLYSIQSGDKKVTRRMVVQK